MKHSHIMNESCQRQRIATTKAFGIENLCAPYRIIPMAETEQWHAVNWVQESCLSNSFRILSQTTFPNFVGGPLVFIRWISLLVLGGRIIRKSVHISAMHRGLEPASNHAEVGALVLWWEGRDLLRMDYSLQP